MRDPRPGLRWSRGRVQRRARYGGYMDSPEWFRRRERWLEQYRGAHGGQEPVCVVCGAPWMLRGGDLHHRTYTRLGAETWQDLVPMCRDHHAALHAVMEQNPAWRKVPREQATDLIAARLRAKIATGGDG
jgi:5-methylcytosine-specific restriction endonuclease McrA